MSLSAEILAFDQTSADDLKYGTFVSNICSLLEQGLSARETLYTICRTARKLNDTFFVDLFDQAVEFSELNSWDHSRSNENRQQIAAELFIRGLLKNGKLRTFL